MIQLSFLKKIREFLNFNEYQGRFQYTTLERKLWLVINRASGYQICIENISYAENRLDQKSIIIF